MYIYICIYIPARIFWPNPHTKRVCLLLQPFFSPSSHLTLIHIQFTPNSPSISSNSTLIQIDRLLFFSSSSSSSSLARVSTIPPTIKICFISLTCSSPKVHQGKRSRSAFNSRAWFVELEVSITTETRSRASCLGSKVSFWFQFDRVISKAIYFFSSDLSAIGISGLLTSYSWIQRSGFFWLDLCLFRVLSHWILIFLCV